MVRLDRRILYKRIVTGAFIKKGTKKLTFTWLIVSLNRSQTLKSSQVVPGDGLPLLSWRKTLGSWMEPPQILQVGWSPFGVYSLQFTVCPPSQVFFQRTDPSWPLIYLTGKLSKLSPPWKPSPTQQSEVPPHLISEHLFMEQAIRK